MRNCIIAQSGGPTSVINSSVMGVVAKNNKIKYYDNVFAGLNGIEGILQEKFFNLSTLTNEQIETIKYTPAAALGSCRYKLKDVNKCTDEYDLLFDIMEKHNIETFFYVGGNDSMDTVNKLSKYAELKNRNFKFFGIPKTIDNDLPIMDHTPGYGSAAKFIASTILENYLDTNVYSKKNVFIVETMGRDTGWLAASAVAARINNKCVVDYIYLPETIFNEEQFLQNVKKKLEIQDNVFVVVSEGIRNAEGTFISELNAESKKDTFGHVQLGGVGAYLKHTLIEKGIVSKVRSLEISTSQRCAMHCASQRDIDESFSLGEAALEYSSYGENGMLVALRRTSSFPYFCEPIIIHTSKIANQIKYVPTDWINPESNHLNDNAFEYISPLIQGQPNFVLENGLPKFLTLRELIS